MLYLGMDRDIVGDIPCVKETAFEWVDEWNFALPTEPWATCAAIDADGRIHIYEHQPIEHFKIDGFGEWVTQQNGRVRYAGEVDMQGVNWRETCVRLYHGN